MNVPNRKPAGRNRRIRAAQPAANRRIAGQKATKVLEEGPLRDTVALF